MAARSSQSGQRGQFTVRVKDELAALRPTSKAERRALLAGLLRFAASLHIEGRAGEGRSRFTLVVASRSGGVARLAFWLLHGTYGVRPDLRVRRPANARAPGARYEVVLAERVERVLVDTAILDGAGRLSHGVPGALVRGRVAAACYLRGAFLGRGSVSSPSREPHLEIGAPNERTARGLAALLTRLDLPARAGVRAEQDLHRVLLKSGEAIGSALATMGATSAYLAWEDGLVRREVRGEAVRLTNADQANLRRSVAAAALRLANPEASLAELGALLQPPRSKGAVLARLRRLQELTEQAGAEERA